MLNASLCACLPGGASLTRPTWIIRRCVCLPGGAALTRPTDGLSVVASACRVALRLPGLRMDYPSLRLPAGWRFAYPAYGWIIRRCVCLPGGGFALPGLGIKCRLLWINVLLACRRPGKRSATGHVCRSRLLHHLLNRQHQNRTGSQRLQFFHRFPEQGFAAHHVHCHALLIARQRQNGRTLRAR